MQHYIHTLFILCLAALLLAACAAQAPAPTAAPAQPAPNLANPASVNYEKQGGQLSIQKRPDGGEYGVCLFEDNRQCEEWALLRGDCPVGGVVITGYVTQAAQFCAITGGEYKITANSNTDQEQGTCTLKTGKTCDAAAYFAGTCSAND